MRSKSSGRLRARAASQGRQRNESVKRPWQRRRCMQNLCAFRDPCRVSEHQLRSDVRGKLRNTARTSWQCCKNSGQPAAALNQLNDMLLACGKKGKQISKLTPNLRDMIQSDLAEHKAKLQDLRDKLQQKLDNTQDR
ncbi:unnamed protein product [Effrenium voratum]|nr:unnamed protein product [Effrenium voratum]